MFIWLTKDGGMQILVNIEKIFYAETRMGGNAGTVIRIGGNNEDGLYVVETLTDINNRIDRAMTRRNDERR